VAGLRPIEDRPDPHLTGLTGVDAADTVAAEDPAHESVYESLAGLLRRLSRSAEVVATYRVAWVGGSTRARKRQGVIR
jgi:hypothetical protein